MEDFFSSNLLLKTADQKIPKNCSKHHPALRWRPESNYRRDADVDHSQIVRGINPFIAPDFGTPAYQPKSEGAIKTSLPQYL